MVFLFDFLAPRFGLCLSFILWVAYGSTGVLCSYPVLEARIRKAKMIRSNEVSALYFSPSLFMLFVSW